MRAIVGQFQKSIASIHGSIVFETVVSFRCKNGNGLRELQKKI